MGHFQNIFEKRKQSRAFSISMTVPLIVVIYFIILNLFRDI